MSAQNDPRNVAPPDANPDRIRRKVSDIPRRGKPQPKVFYANPIPPAHHGTHRLEDSPAVPSPYYNRVKPGYYA